MNASVSSLRCGSSVRRTSTVTLLSAMKSCLTWNNWNGNHAWNLSLSHVILMEMVPCHMVNGAAVWQTQVSICSCDVLKDNSILKVFVFYYICTDILYYSLLVTKTNLTINLSLNLYTRNQKPTAINVLSNWVPCWRNKWELESYLSKLQKKETYYKSIAQTT